MLEFAVVLLAAVRVFFRSRGSTAIEILALRQQVAVLERKQPRPKLSTFDRLFWTTLRGVWSRWAEVLVIVRSESVVSAAAEFLTATAPPELLPGETVAHYRVEAKLGHGGMGCGPTHVEHFR